MKEGGELHFETVFLKRGPPADERVGELMEWGKRLSGLGLAPNDAGNLSFRTEDGFIITGVGVMLDSIEKAKLAKVMKVVNNRGRRTVYTEGCAIPSRECILHCKLYGLKTEVNVIFHLHDALVLKRADGLNIPVTAEERPPGSYEMAVEATELLASLPDVSYFALKNHGIVSMGTSLEEAGSLVERMRAKAERFAL